MKSIPLLLHYPFIRTDSHTLIVVIYKVVGCDLISERTNVEQKFWSKFVLLFLVSSDNAGY